MTRLQELEEVIGRGLKTFVAVGDALIEIRDSRLYRETFETFEDYCRERWGFTDRRARQLIDAAQIGTTVPVENERQARELARLGNSDERRETWLEVESSGERVTAASLREVVERRLDSPKLAEVLSRYPALDIAATRSDAFSIAAELDAMDEAARPAVLKKLAAGDFETYAALTGRPLIVALEERKCKDPALKWQGAIRQVNVLASEVSALGGITQLIRRWGVEERAAFYRQTCEASDELESWKRELKASLKKVA